MSVGLAWTRLVRFSTVLFNSSIYFFFQAEDGIRDADVTGVQTCALPISRAAHRPASARPGRRHLGRGRPRRGRDPRSEERRVGKECRARWAGERWKQKILDSVDSYRQLIDHDCCDDITLLEHVVRT